MKTLKNFILESERSLNDINIFKGLKGAQASEKIIQTLKKISKTKKINLNDRKSVTTLWQKFLGESGYTPEFLSAIGLKTADNLRTAILNNMERILEMWPEEATSKIKDFNLSETEKKYRAWKKSDKYVKGEDFKGKDAYSDEDEEDLERVMVVYNANDPGDQSTVKTYKLLGKVGKDTQEQINMFKVDWKYETGLKYFDARPCLLSHYLKKSDSELQKLYDDDIIGLMD